MSRQKVELEVLLKKDIESEINLFIPLDPESSDDYIIENDNIYIKQDIKYDNGLVIEKKSIHEENQKWDLIMLHHVLEHMDNQKDVIKSIHEKLQEVGDTKLILAEYYFLINDYEASKKLAKQAVEIFENQQDCKNNQQIKQDCLAKILIAKDLLEIKDTELK